MPSQFLMLCSLLSSFISFCACFMELITYRYTELNLSTIQYNDIAMIVRFENQHVADQCTFIYRLSIGLWLAKGVENQFSMLFMDGGQFKSATSSQVLSNSTEISNLQNGKLSTCAHNSSIAHQKNSNFSIVSKQLFNQT